MRAVAELLTYLAAAVWVKHHTHGKPSEDPSTDTDKWFANDQRYCFVFSQLPNIAPLIGTFQGRPGYWLTITTVVTLPDPCVRGTNPDCGPVEKLLKKALNSH